MSHKVDHVNMLVSGVLSLGLRQVVPLIEATNTLSRMCFVLDLGSEL